MEITISNLTHTDYYVKERIEHFKLFNISVEEPLSKFEIVKTPCLICGKELTIKVCNAKTAKRVNTKNKLIALILLIYITVIISTVSTGNLHFIIGLLIYAAIFPIFGILYCLGSLLDKHLAKIIGFDAMHKVVEESERRM